MASLIQSHMEHIADIFQRLWREPAGAAVSPARFQFAVKKVLQHPGRDVAQLGVAQFSCKVPFNSELVVGGGRGPQGGLRVGFDPVPKPGDQRVLAGPNVVAILNGVNDPFKLLGDLFPRLPVYAPFLPLESVLPFP